MNEDSCENASPENKNKSTPPPTNKKIRNPFDKALIDRLHKPICSPGMCTIYKKKATGLFRWEIDQACSLAPEDIVPCSSQFEPSPDPALEKMAEEATERFFSQELVIPSPIIESSKKIKPLLTSTESIEISYIKKEPIEKRDVSAQTILTLPPELPLELENILQKYCTFTEEQNISGDYEITANGSLRRKLMFEYHSDAECYDSEQTDDEAHNDAVTPANYAPHDPIVFSPDLPSRDLVTKGMKRTFDTPSKKAPPCGGKSYRNKILDAVDMCEPCFSPIQFRTPPRAGHSSVTTPSFTPTSISPLAKIVSSDEEKNNFTSPEPEAMASCFDCIQPEHDSKRLCYCKETPDKSILRRSASLKESPVRCRKSSFSFSEKRSLSMSSLHRSRSVQKLDFSLDMSVDGSLFDQSQADADPSPLDKEDKASWSMVEDGSIHQLVAVETFKNTTSIQSSTKVKCETLCLLDSTPVKSKFRAKATRQISKIRTPKVVSPLNMSLDSSIHEHLNLEHKKIDLNNIDLKFLTDNTQFGYANSTKVGSSDSSTSFRRIDSGFNENTFTSYYESAIKPSELTVTNSSAVNERGVLKETSNVNWMRVDSGFKDENSADSVQFYQFTESSRKGATPFNFSEVKLEDKENVMSGDFERFIKGNKNEPMSISDIFTDDMTFNCNFSSTPSKNKRKTNS